MTAAVAEIQEPRERRSAPVAAFFRYIADAVELNERDGVSPAELFKAAVVGALALVNLGTLPALTALDAEQATRMIDRSLVGRGVTARDIINTLRALADEVSP